MSEREPSPESEISDERIIEALRNNGVEVYGVWLLLTVWELQERNRLGEETEGRVRLDMRKADVYFHGGYYEEALQSLKDARRKAREAHRDGLEDEIDALTERIARPGDSTYDDYI
jgi:hypothetical protein